MEWVKLGDVTEINIGKTPDRKNTNYWGQGNIWVSISDMNSKYISNSKEEITDLAVSESNIKIIPENTVIMSFKLTIGKVAITEIPLFTNEAIASFKIDENLIPEYLYYVLRFIDYDKYVDRAAKGKTLNKKKLNQIKIPVCSLQEQNKIIDNLRKIESIISTRKTQIAALNELVQSVFYEMFGKYRILGSNSSSTKIKDIAEVISGATPKTSVPEYWDGDILWVTPAEINEDGIYLYDTNRKITEAGVGSAALKVIPENSVLLSSRAPIGKVAINKKKLYTNQGFKSIVPNGDYIMPIYLYFLLYFNTEYLNSLGNGATFKEISKKVVENISIPLPPLELQEQFLSLIHI